ncbi:hypothetical protein NIASO_20585 [Niabella soli DSM 19437]|uniref:Uncharacterized protein n=1 Tax=Niabella soli DSM 19437 TaxID=929713 RepID=W0F4U5_9BACT|nr:hypothetical protein NIASO_20585 [Niabella soli DSM 19437]
MILILFFTNEQVRVHMPVVFFKDSAHLHDPVQIP